MATIEFLVELQDKFGIAVSVSKFDRSQWNSVAKICEQIRKLQK